MAQTLMDYKDPRKPLKMTPSEERVNRHRKNPLVMEAVGEAEQKTMARALDFQEERKRERAEDEAAEAAEAAQRTFLGKVWHVGIIFFFGQLPDAVSEVADRARDFLKRGKP